MRNFRIIFFLIFNGVILSSKVFSADRARGESGKDFVEIVQRYNNETGLGKIRKASKLGKFLNFMARFKYANVLKNKELFNQVEVDFRRFVVRSMPCSAGRNKNSDDTLSSLIELYRKKNNLPSNFDELVNAKALLLRAEEQIRLAQGLFEFHSFRAAMYTVNVSHDLLLNF